MYWVDSGTEEIGKALRRGEHGPRRKAVVHGCDYASRNRHLPDVVFPGQDHIVARQGHGAVFDPQCKQVAAKLQTTSSASHAGGRRGSPEVLPRPNTGEAEDERLPDAAHRREV